MVWVDLEMTGLDPRKDFITEIATVITDSNLEVVAEGPDLVIHVPDENLIKKLVADKDFPLEQGFAEEILKSTISTEETERQTLEFIEQYVEKGTSPLCGNTISMDRFFLTFHMPKIIEYLHYRNIDVSTLKELARRWNPSVFSQTEGVKKKLHRAKDDILESIEELRFYRKFFLTAD